MVEKVKETMFHKLRSIDFSKYIEQKENQNYLSWAWAWDAIKRQCPDVNYEVVKNPNSGLPYFESHAGAMVFTKVTIDGTTHEMWLPVMDGNNNAMKSEPYTYQVKDFRTKKMVEKKVEAFTMFEVNRAIMRCLVKNLAMFGLALYLYAGEDIPEEYVPDMSEQLESFKTAIEVCATLAELQTVYADAIAVLKRDRDAVAEIVRVKDKRKAELS